MRSATDSWIERVRAADAEAEARWEDVKLPLDDEAKQTFALIAIAAELRAARIARRPGAGKS